ncbi:MAG: EamA family transporter [Thermoleophilia bacterium]|nr:EamA family transporter [Thermoleophilia bacterium]
MLRFCIAGPLLCAVALVVRARRPGRRLALAALAVGAFQLGAGVALFEGFARAPIGLVTLAFYVYPLLVTVAAALLFGEALGRVRAVAVGAGLGGIALIVGLPQDVSLTGVVLGLVGGVSVAVVVLASRQLMVGHGLAPLWLSALTFTGPALALAGAVAVVPPEAPPAAAAWGWAVAAAVISASLAVMLFYSGMRRVGASSAAILANGEPLTAVVLGWAVLGEALTVIQLMGGALIVAAVVVFAREPGGGDPGA